MNRVSQITQAPLIFLNYNTPQSIIPKSLFQIQMRLNMLENFILDYQVIFNSNEFDQIKLVVATYLAPFTCHNGNGRMMVIKATLPSCMERQPVWCQKPLGVLFFTYFNLTHQFYNSLNF